MNFERVVCLLSGTVFANTRIPNVSDSSPTKKWLIAGAQGLVSVALLAWIFKNPEFRSEIRHTLLSAKPSWLLAGVALAGAGSFLCVLRWRIFLHMLGLKVAFWDTVRIMLVGQFFDTFVIGTFGGDVVRVAMLAGRGCGKSLAVLSVILDRLSGTVSLLLLSCILIGSNRPWLARSPSVAVLMNTIFIYLLVISVLLAFSFIVASTKFARRLPESFSWRKKIMEMEEQYFLFVSCWPQSLRAAGMSMIMLAMHFTVYFCSSRAYGLEVPWFHFVSIMPVVDIITGLPISLGGVGVREQLFISLLGGLCRTPSAIAASVSMAGFLITSLWGVVGFLFWSTEKAASGFKK